jgi:hypothetical protein
VQSGQLVTTEVQADGPCSPEQSDSGLIAGPDQVPPLMFTRREKKPSRSPVMSLISCGSGRFPPSLLSSRSVNSLRVNGRFAPVISEHIPGPRWKPSWKEETRSKALPCALRSPADVPIGSRKLTSDPSAESSWSVFIRRCAALPSATQRMNEPA